MFHHILLKFVVFSRFSLNISFLCILRILFFGTVSLHPSFFLLFLTYMYIKILYCVHEIQEHIKTECDMTKQQCPSCSALLLRKELKVHRCPLLPIECPFTLCGCTEKVRSQSTSLSLHFSHHSTINECLLDSYSRTK